MNSRQDGAASDIHKGPHPPKSWDTWPVQYPPQLHVLEQRKRATFSSTCMKIVGGA